MKSYLANYYLLILWIVILFIGCGEKNKVQNQAEERIQPFTENPYYWQYKERPILLIGGSWQDNLFNHPANLEEHLDLMESVGANYVRNVMSHRNEGNVFAYRQNNEGLFDLDRFNEEYWQRLENFLEMTFDRDIIVQLEIWATWDHYEDHQSLGGWSYHPFNPQNNSIYTPEESGLPTEVDYPPQTNPTDHSFFRSVPALDNNELLLRFQQEYVDRILSYSLNYPHIIYTMNNETGEHVEWGDYWADYVRYKSREIGMGVEITDMRRNEDIRSEDHAHIFENPERYTFVDISQNNAWSGLGQGHYDNILYARERLAPDPRPINNNKNYGAIRHGEEESVARMGRIFFGGGASARFHRPHPLEDPADHEAKSEWGLGLSPRAQQIIRSLRMVFNVLEVYRTEPRNDLLGDRTENEAYLLAETGLQYGVYFPDGGSVTIDLADAEGEFRYRWINLGEGEWGDSEYVTGGDAVRFTPPDSGHWIAVINKTD